jgi:hypothetical protein
MGEQRINDTEIYRLIQDSSDDEETVNNSILISEISEDNYEVVKNVEITVEEQDFLDNTSDDDNSENIPSNRQSINEVINKSKKERTCRIINKRLRDQGAEYMGEVKSASGVILVKKAKRSVGERCDVDKCGKLVKYKCKEFSDEDRQQIFNEFYLLESSMKIVYVKTLIKDH